MQQAPCIALCVPKEERIANIVSEYGDISGDILIERTLKIKKRLGCEKTTQVIQFIREHKLQHAVEMILGYYDGAYACSMQARPGRILSLPVSLLHHIEDALIQMSKALGDSYETR
jgi:hypothetical protein